jgi:hypothetical protein
MLSDMELSKIELTKKNVTHDGLTACSLRVVVIKQKRLQKIRKASERCYPDEALKVM